MSNTRTWARVVPWRPPQAPPGVRRRQLGLLAVLFVLVAAAGVWLVTPGGFYGCSSKDEALASRLGELPELRLHPTDAVANGEVSSGCEDDDQLAGAARGYQPSGNRAQVRAFYRVALLTRGWVRVRAATDCYARRIEGRTTYLTVVFDADEGLAGTGYVLGVAANRHGGGDLC